MEIFTIDDDIWGVAFFRNVDGAWEELPEAKLCALGDDTALTEIVRGGKYRVLHNGDTISYLRPVLSDDWCCFEAYPSAT